VQAAGGARGTLPCSSEVAHGLAAGLGGTRQALRQAHGYVRRDPLQSAEYMLGRRVFPLPRPASCGHLAHGHALNRHPSPSTLCCCNAGHSCAPDLEHRDEGLCNLVPQEGGQGDLGAVAVPGHPRHEGRLDLQRSNRPLTLSHCAEGTAPSLWFGRVAMLKNCLH